MVDCQIRPTKVTDDRVIDAFASIPREAFVGRNQRAIAYVDEDLPLPGGRCMMEPMVLARLIQALSVEADDNVLVIGAATGYGAAILARLATSVIAVETRTQMV
ncbi:MAG TPA: protein-L-isoaspartate O-methyltransferase, partial [Alphaproteobacteria bacterium]|nr:protein-L-isoaspartate O-methyltransferase [Alphaproteobacteria bacterium]